MSEFNLDPKRKSLKFNLSIKFQVKIEKGNKFNLEGFSTKIANSNFQQKGRKLIFNFKEMTDLKS